MTLNKDLQISPSIKYDTGFDLKKLKNLELIKEFDTTIPEVVMGDKVRLHQIILNLLGTL
jgi:signal transduction histidine kinase